jgi:hypothetical protein
MVEFHRSPLIHAKPHEPLHLPLDPHPQTYIFGNLGTRAGNPKILVPPHCNTLNPQLHLQEPRTQTLTVISPPQDFAKLIDYKACNQFDYKSHHFPFKEQKPI